MENENNQRIGMNKIPCETPIEEQLENLKLQLDWQKREDKLRNEKTKLEAFRLAVQIRPNGYSTEDLIKSANKIYEELIKQSL